MGLLVTFEGGEGVGKSTQIRLAAGELERRGFPVRTGREPGGPPMAERIREILLDPGSAGMDPLSELLLYEAARREHVTATILPALARGEVVLVDRFTDATMSYQGYGRGLDRRLIARLNTLATGGRPPDLTLFFDGGDPGAGLERARARGDRHEGRFEEEPLAFHRRVRAGYLRLARREPHRIRVVDASGSVEEVHRRVMEAMEGVLPRG
jgi:dTMP kinase